MVRAKKDSCPVKPIVGVFNSGAEVLDFQNSRPRMCGLQKLGVSDGYEGAEVHPVS
jgi:hypothetical protein